MLVILIIGVEVHVSEKAEIRTRLASAALADALTAEKILASVKSIPGKESPRPELITIYVGKNPSSMQPITVPQQ
jgi:hypothetical protein